MKKIRVAVGLSGGVDSAVSAYLLKKRGFDISGVYLDCFDDDAPGCRGKQDRRDALKVAVHLKIPFQVLDFRRQYKSAVIAYFKKEYLAGRTPNPDVICNRDIKFGLLLDWCIKNGFDYLATGHYARLRRSSRKSRTAANNHEPYRKRRKKFEFFVNFRDFREALPDIQSKPRQSQDSVFLTQPKDLHKDQTYFLWAVPRQKFSRVLFPLANITKKDVRSLAKLSKIPVADKPDSTGICFIGEVRVEDFLKRLGVKEKRGEVVIMNRQSVAVAKPVSASGGDNRNRLTKRASQTQPHNDFVVIGSHRGVWFYTIGQRHGFSTDLWSSKNDRPPLYVISKDVRRNRLVVGFGADCYRDSFQVSNCNWLVSDFGFQISDFPHVFVRIRHLGDLIPCSVIGSPFSVISSESAGYQSIGQKPADRKPANQNLKTENRELITVFLSIPQRGVAPGQSAVFYLKNGIVLGGGIIQ